MLVRVLERVGDLARDLERVLEGQAPLALQPVAQRFALYVRHHVVQHPGGLTGVVQRQDVRVGETRDDLDLAEEALGAERGGQLRPQDLQRDLPAEALVVGQVDEGHAAAPELALDGVAAGEGIGQTVLDVAHRL